ncbi:MAG: YybH family protein [Pyrinomonadaceae bacterium]
MKTKITLLFAAAMLLAAACNQASAPGKPESAKADNSSPVKSDAAKPSVDRAAEEKAIREADIAWSNATGKKDVEAAMAFIADDAVMLPPNAPMLSGKEAVKKEWNNMMALNDLSIKWEPTKVQVAESGDIGYTIGTYEMSFTDPKAGKVNDKGKYVEIWKKVNGKWVCQYDMYNSDIPAAK